MSFYYRIISYEWILRKKKTMNRRRIELKKKNISLTDIHIIIIIIVT